MAITKYATKAQVESEFLDETFGDTDKIKTTEIDGWIEEFSAEVDSKIQKRYAVPVTDADALIVLRIIVLKFMKAKILPILGQNSPSQKKKAMTEAKELEEAANQMIEDIKSGKIDLFSAGKSGITVSNSYVYKESKEPTIEKDTEQW